MKRSFVFPLVLAAGGLAVQGAEADFLAVDPNNVEFVFNNLPAAFTRGYLFTVAAGSQYTVTALGVFDETAESGPGLTEAHEVGLWNADGTALLAQVTVPSGTAGTLVPSSATLSSIDQGDWRFANLGSPVVLGPGSYLIGAFYAAGGSDRYLSLANTNLGTVSTLSGLTVTEGKLILDPSFGAPTLNNSSATFGPSFLVAEPTIVNPDLSVAVSGQSTNTTPVVPEGPAGVFSFTATYCNRATSPTLTSLFSRTRVLTNGNSLVNRDRDGTGTPPGGVGSELDFPLSDDYTDGLLDPTECVEVPYQIGLQVRRRFSFFVDALGADAIVP